MTVGVNSLLNTGKGALLAFQSAIHVTGENIANVNTPGYSRRSVRLEENPSIDYRPGQIGMGVTAKEVIRHYDYFIERQYLDKSSSMNRWDALYSNMRQVEMLFDETVGDKLNTVMSKFWADWQNVSLRPDDMASRSQLVSTSQNMSLVVNQLERDLSLFQRQMDDFIRQDVDRANELLAEIADINGKIAIHDIPGENNANALLDKRDTMVRELAGLLDIQTQDKGNGEFFIMTTAGHTLVDGKVFFELKFEGAKSFAALANGSSGTINFSGSSEREFLVEIVDPGPVPGPPATDATFKVSLDGGVSWLKDDAGLIREFDVSTTSQKIEGLDIWFDAGWDLNTGDKFTIVPKSGLYWYENTSSEMNITPQIHFNGQDNHRRITGGSLTGFFNFRDDYIGNFREKLNGLASTMAWEVNRIHSQGAGLEKFGQVLGTYDVSNTGIALNSLSSGLFYGDKLQQGNLSIWVYDSNGTGTAYQLDFPAGNFDPSNDSLDDVVAAINWGIGSEGLGDYVVASTVDNRLQVTAENGYTFAFGSDTTGLLAALGINTFFDGTDARDFSMNQEVFNNLSFINAGHVNGAGEINAGDNETSKVIAALQYDKVDFQTSFQGRTSQTIQNFYASLVADAGAVTSSANFNYNYNKALTDDLQNRQEAISGVNLDEEMSSLIKFQHSYSAAAKLISTADQMFQTILSMK